MNINEMNMEQVEARLAAIREELRSGSDNVDALAEEVTQLEARRAAIAAAAEARSALLNKIAGTQGAPAASQPLQRTDEEIRRSAEYIDAFEAYIRTGRDEECRALLSENAPNGTIPVPVFVEEIVRTAWDRNEITRLVRKTYLRGNVKKGFELSSTDAINHVEGTADITEETLVTGIVTLTAAEVSKWVSISRETYQLHGEAFLRYIYEELTYKIAQQIANNLLTEIISCTTVGTATQVPVGLVTSTTLTVSLVAEAMAQLSDQAPTPVAIMNRATWGALKQAQAANKYNYDPFEGLPVIYNNSLKAFSAASSGDTYMIVGDLASGAQLNLPDGDSPSFIFDEVTAATAGMIKVYGNEMASIKPIAPKAFTKVTK